MAKTRNQRLVEILDKRDTKRLTGFLKMNPGADHETARIIIEYINGDHDGAMVEPTETEKPEAVAPTVTETEAVVKDAKPSGQVFSRESGPTESD